MITRSDIIGYRLAIQKVRQAEWLTDKAKRKRRRKRDRAVMRQREVVNDYFSFLESEDKNMAN